MDIKNSKTARLVLTGMLAAAALAVSFFERTAAGLLALPPGIKPGLSNIIVMFVCSALGLFAALATALIKSGFVFLISGAAAGFISLCGGVLSVAVMYLLIKHMKKLSFSGISVISAVSHNMGQLFAASLIAGSPLYLAWAPALLISAVIFGLITGTILNCVMPAIEKKF